MKKLTSLLALAIISMAFTEVYGQIKAKIIDINPDTSTLDARNPNGASGGRVNKLGYASDGSAYYAASEWGGLYKSTDVGRKWKRLENHIPVATWDVEVDPNNSNKVYATSFFDGKVQSLAGINVSSDGGETWTHPTTALPPAPPYTTAQRRAEPSAFGISIDPANSNNVYIGTNAGLAISNNAGATWRYIDPTPGTSATNVWDVIVHNGGIIDLVGDDGHRRSTDGGNTWTTATSSPLPGGISSITVSPDESYVLFATTGTLVYESNNGGTSWSLATNPSPQGRIPFVKTNQRSGNTYDLWFGDQRLWRDTCTTPNPATPGGSLRGPGPVNSWAGAFVNGGHWDCGDIIFDPTVSTDACPLLYASDGGVYYNTRTGANCHTPVWEQPDSTPHTLWLFAMDGAPQAGATNEDLYFGNQDNGTFAAANAGVDKPAWNNRQCCDGFDISANPNQVLYTVCCCGGRGCRRFNRLFLRNQGMTGGSEINNYPPGNIPGFRPTNNIAQFGASGYAVITVNGLFITNNINAIPIVWTQLGTASSPANMGGLRASVDASNNPVFFIQQPTANLRGSDQIWRFNGTNANGTWQQVSSPTTNGGFSIFNVDPNNANKIIACNVDASNNPKMVMTTDGGTNWSDLPELDNLMTGKGAFFYRNQRGPTNFTGFGGYFQPNLIAFYPQDSDIIVAGGADSGVFVSRNGGDCWLRITDPFDPGNSEIPHIPRPQFAYFSQQANDPNGNEVIDLFIGTQGRGVWRIELTLENFQNTVVTRPGCVGGCDGSIDLVFDGATSATKYSWSNGSTTQDLSGLCAGTYTVTIEDSNGCQEASFTVLAGVDVTPPTITCPAGRNVTTDSGNCSTVINYTVSTSDNCSGETLVQTAGLASGASFPVGVSTNSFRVTDTSGNTSTCSFTVTVADSEDPTISCPAPRAVNTDAGVCGAIVNYTVSASDNCSGEVLTQTGGLANGALFPVGTTTNTFSVRDASGNTNSCTFNIVVEDKEVPQALCQNVTVNLDNNGVASITTNQVDAGSSDACGVANLSLDQQNFDCSQIGNNTVSLTVTDPSGNTGSCTANISVVDNIPPTISCPAKISIPCDTSTANTGIPTISDNCGANLLLNHTTTLISGDCNWFCRLQRTFTVADQSGNTNQCVQDIEKDLTPLIQQAINVDVDKDGNPDALVFGVTQTTLTVNTGQGNCITSWLPHDGTTPRALRRGNETVGTNCAPGTNVINGSGKITNPLFAEAIKLSIILRLDPDFGNTSLNSLSCQIAPIVLQNLSNTPTVSELMDVTNKALGNLVLVPHLNELLAALECINAPLEICNAINN